MIAWLVAVVLAARVADPSDEGCRNAAFSGAGLPGATWRGRAALAKRWLSPLTPGGVDVDATAAFGGIRNGRIPVGAPTGTECARDGQSFKRLTC